MSLVLDILDRTGEHYRHHASKPHEVMLNCPFCIERGKDSEDRLYRLGINYRLLLAHCHRCDYTCKGLKRLISELCRVYHLPEPTIQYTDLSAAEIPGPIKEPEPLPEAVETGFPEGYETFTFETGKDEVHDAALDYLLNKRKLIPEQVMEHRVGFAAWGEYAYRVVFPVIGSDQRIYGYACRSFADQLPRYLNSPGTKMMWGAHRTGKIAIESEGILSALAVERVTMTMPGVVNVAPLGSATTDLQLKQLEAYESVLLFPDHDKAGVQGCIKRAKKYIQHGLKVFVVIPRRLDEKDACDLDPQFIRTELDRAEKWTDYTEFKLRLVD